MRSPVPAFRFTGVIPLLWPRLSHSTPDTQFRVGSSLQAGLYARTPPFSPTAAPVPVTIDLSPTRKDTTKRHWQQPLVTWFADDLLAKHEVALEVCASVRLHWKDRFGCCALRKPVTTVQKLAGLLNLRKKPPCRVVFSFSDQEITAVTQRSQEDLKICGKDTG